MTEIRYIVNMVYHFTPAHTSLFVYLFNIDSFEKLF